MTIDKENRIESIEEYFSSETKHVTYIFIKEINLKLFYKINQENTYKGLTFKKEGKYYLWIPVVSRPESFLLETEGVKAHENKYLELSDETIHFELDINLEEDIKNLRVYGLENHDDTDNATIELEHEAFKEMLEYV